MRTFQQVAVLGFGTMGGGIAQVLAIAGGKRTSDRATFSISGLEVHPRPHLARAGFNRENRQGLPPGDFSRRTSGASPPCGPCSTKTRTPSA